MAETVGQHTVAAFTSPVNGSTPIDANTVRGNDNTIRVAYVDHDADPGIHVQSSALASRPIAGVAGRKWMTVDGTVTRLWYDTGSTWLEMQAGAFSTARTLWGQSFDGTANVSGNLSSVGNIAMTGALSGATSLSATSVSATNVTGTLQTAAQPNVTSVGTLSSLAVSGTTKIGSGAASNTSRLMVNTPSGSAAGIQLFQDGNASWIIENIASSATLRIAESGVERLSISGTGNLAVDTNTLFVDAANNRVGVGTASPTTTLHVTGNQYRQNDATNSFGFTLDCSSSVTRLETLFGGSSFAIRTGASGSDRLVVDAVGNLGLGVTPSAWGAAYRTAQISSGAIGSSTTNNAVFTSNTFWNGTAWVYIATDTATFYQQTAGQHRWFNAASGTAGATVTFTQAMTLDASGNLGVGVTPTYRLDALAAAGAGNVFRAGQLSVSNGYTITTSGTALTHRWANAGTDAMTLDANGRLLVGTTSAVGYMVEAYIASGNNGISIQNGANAAGDFAVLDFRQAGTQRGVIYTNQSNLTINANGGVIALQTGSSERARIDASGNLGLGVTPSTTSIRTLQVLNTSLSSPGSDLYLTGNAVFNSPNWVYLTSSTAAQYVQSNGTHQWLNAASGTAGATVNLTQRMVLDANGNLIVGTDPGGTERIRVTGGIRSAGDILLANSSVASIGTVTNQALRLITNNGIRVHVSEVGGVHIGGTTDAGSGNLIVNGWVRASSASAGAASTTTIGNGTATTVGATGAAAALPANPLGYIIAHVGTTQVKIPYYTA